MSHCIRSWIGLILLFSLFSALGQAQLLKDGRAEVRARVVYRGLVIGKARSEDLIKIVGRPSRIEAFPKENEEAYVYLDRADEVELIARIKTPSRIIYQIEHYPQNLNISEAEKIYGTRYRKATYDFDECLGEGGSAPLFESPRGSIEFLEYRDKGIFLRLEGSGPKVEEVRYSSEPPGRPKSQCRKQK